MNITYEEVKTISNFIDAIRIRVDVFILEQKCPPGWEPDELDKSSKHYIAVLGDEIIATARLREDSKKVAKMERMVVKKEQRGRGVGLDLTTFMIQQARKQGYKKIKIQAQLHAKNMYEKAGFKTTSKTYDLWNLGIPHVDMEYVFE